MKQLHLLLVLLAATVTVATNSTFCHAESLPDEYGTGVIVGRVVYGNGKPAAGVRIVAEMQRAFEWGLTKKGLIKRIPGGAYDPKSVPFLIAQSNIAAVSQTDGTFRLHGLITAPYNLKVTDSPSKVSWYMTGMPSEWTAPAAEGVWAKDGQTVRRTRDIVLVRGALIQGQVLDENGKSVARVYVASYGPHRPHSGDSVAVAVTDDEGNYSMRVPPGKIEVYIAGPWDKVAKVAGKAEITLGHNQPQVKSHFSDMTVIQVAEGETYHLKYRLLLPEQPKVQAEPAPKID